MKTLLLITLCCLIGIKAQTTTPCATLTTAETCRTTGAGRCVWARGINCNNTVYEYCRPNVACGDAITCAMPRTNLNAGAAFSFQDTCIPEGWVPVDFSRCVCQNPPTCSSPCTNCALCENGRCGTPITNFRCFLNGTTNEDSCPRGYSCRIDNCRSYCVPDCAATDRVSCTVDPCSLPRPDGCDVRAICVPDYCNGCTRHFIDPTSGQEVCNECSNTECGTRPPSEQCPDGTTGGSTGRCLRGRDGRCAWEVKECPRTCPVIRCNTYCEYGFQRDSNGCPTCTCNPAPCRDATTVCPRIVCDNGRYPYFRPGQCCPNCSDPCEGVLCPQVRCEAGFVYRVPEGSCCGRCYPEFDCSTVRCAMSPDDTCPAGSVKVRRGCCVVCERELVCDRTVDCPTIDCPSNTKRVVRSGRCCPDCEPIRDCSNIQCPTASCPTGTAAVRRDLECCDRCEPVDRCATVLCARPPCRPEAWVQRRGECCPQCPTCRDSNDGRRICDINDDPVCRAGYTRGNNCSDDVPPADRDERVIIIRRCNRGPCDRLEVQEMRTYLARRAGVSERHVFAEHIGRASDDQCCFKYTIIISRERNDNSFDVDAARNQIAAAVGAEPDWSVETSTTGSPVATGGSTSDAEASEGSLITFSFFSMCLLLISLL